MFIYHNLYIIVFIFKGMIKEVLDSFYFQLGWQIGLVLVIAFVLRYLVSSSFSKFFKKLEREEGKEKAKVRKTRLELLRKFLTIIIFVSAFIVILFMIPGFKNIAYSVVAGAGVGAVVIGFAAQKSLSNVLAGISIAIYAPFRVGDRLKIFEEFGEVKDINLRHTTIKTWDNKMIVIPNALMDEKEIVNFSLEGDDVLWTLNMGISYDSSIDKARKIMEEEAKKHPSNLSKKDKDKKEPYVRVTECGNSAVNLRVYYWCQDLWEAWKMSHELREQIKKRFDKEGIEIPFPYRTVVYKKDLEKNAK